MAWSVLVAACGDGGWGSPDNGGPPGPPTDPPPTGSKWQGKETTDACGRVGLEYVLVDEVCGGTTDPGYMAAFHSPIVRDGALIGSDLFAVDATYLWVLDVSDPAAPSRKALVSGLGEPLALATHAGHLVIASGEEGLVIAETANPAAPTRLATVALSGPALDVFVEGDRAFVAMGSAGVAVVDLITGAVERELAAPGFVAAVAAKNGLAYVTACNTFTIVDVATGDVVGQTWLDDAEVDGVLVAPAKVVALAGDVAFVAAGRRGAVSIDVSDPTTPTVLGNCAVDDPSFYASGVRTDGDRLFVAGGEWGILPLDIGSPLETCSFLIAPSEPPPSEEPTCSTAPPWDIVPWVDTWSPPPTPPEGRDPIQTLPAGDLVFAFGDATRIGLRAIDVRLANDPELAKIGRYAEPRLTEGIAARDDLVLVAGKVGGLYRNVGDGLVLDQDLTIAKSARAAAFLDDGRWVLGEPVDGGASRLHIESAASPVPLSAAMWPGTLVTTGTSVFIPATAGAIEVDADGEVFALLAGRTARLPAALAFSNDELVMAAPEWVDAVTVQGGTFQPLDTPGVFDEAALSDVSSWRRALPRRQLLVTTAGLCEISSLGGHAGLVLHGASDVTVELPPGDYVAGAARGDRVFLASVDRGTYRTTLTTVSVADGAPVLVGSASFTGTASGLATSADRLYVADGDRGVRIYDLASEAPSLVSIVDLVVGGAP
jgi:hypothetical protein